MSDIENQVSAILAAGGFTPMPRGEMRGIFCKETGGGWWMGGVHAGGVHSKHTRMSDTTTDDPIQAAHELVDMASRLAGAPAQPIPRLEDIESLVGDVYTPPEPERIPQDETHGETLQASDDAAPENVAYVGEHDVDASSGHDASDDGEQPGRDDHAEEWRDDPGVVLDADYLEANELEDYSLGAEIEAANAEAAGAFIFGDNLEQKRTAAIGLVIRHARTLMPFWTTNHLAALIELRNFAMGVAENRWPDDPGRRLELESYETTLRRISEIERARDAKVEFLEGASRAEVESFEVEADWP